MAHPIVSLVQALAKHLEQLVALQDEIRETTCRKYKQLQVVLPVVVMTQS